MNQEDTLKDSVKTVEDVYRASKKTNEIINKTGMTIDKSTKRLYGLTLNSTEIVASSLINLFENLFKKNISWKNDSKNLKTLYSKGLPLSSNDCDINDLRLFQKIMKHHEVEYSLKKDCLIEGRYNIFFLARDSELIEQALKRFIRADRFKDIEEFKHEDNQNKLKKTEKVMPENHENDKKSTLEKLEKAKEKANLSNKNKEKVKEKKQELIR
ncbi:hypothetical protein J2Z35_002014 [Acetoanaerobium pronyense]|uniref:DUF3801 domain-containing protein n=1 Tax=Acetoanaerobium pronyense TaxID=1482736 RepID=A0ABS4KKA3_9FIRM|nr:DUF3801 domain-containing protein [Acetoanaerobium pronyense]MBP2028213.1 hypothetical protein [Acetoanaerobium pronyense]